jgi:hypothetical protein
MVVRTSDTLHRIHNTTVNIVSNTGRLYIIVVIIFKCDHKIIWLCWNVILVFSLRKVTKIVSILFCVELLLHINYYHFKHKSR